MVNVYKKRFNKGSAMVEIILYIIIFSMVALILFNNIFYFLNAVIFLFNNHEDDSIVIDKLKNILRFSYDVYYLDNELDFYYQNKNYVLREENEGVILLKEGELQLKLLNYSIKSLKYENYLYDIVFQNNDKEISLKVINLN